MLKPFSLPTASPEPFGKRQRETPNQKKMPDPFDKARNRKARANRIKEEEKLKPPTGRRESQKEYEKKIKEYEDFFKNPLNNPKFAGGKANFEKEEQWLKDMLNKQWSSYDDATRARIGNFMPYDTLKAFLFYSAQGQRGLNWENQFLPAEEIARQIYMQAEAKYQKYKQEKEQARLDLADYKKKYSDYIKEQMKNPLPFRKQLRNF